MEITNNNKTPNRTQANSGSHNDKFPRDIEEAIEQGTAVAVVDASVKGSFMVASWIITILDNRNRIEGQISSPQWGRGVIN